MENQQEISFRKQQLAIPYPPEAVLDAWRNSLSRCTGHVPDNQELVAAYYLAMGKDLKCLSDDPETLGPYVPYSKPLWRFEPNEYGEIYVGTIERELLSEAISIIRTGLLMPKYMHSPKTTKAHTQAMQASFHSIVPADTVEWNTSPIDH